MGPVKQIVLDFVVGLGSLFMIPSFRVKLLKGMQEKALRSLIIFVRVL